MNFKSERDISVEQCKNYYAEVWLTAIGAAPTDSSRGTCSICAKNTNERKLTILISEIDGVIELLKAAKEYHQQKISSIKSMIEG